MARFSQCLNKNFNAPLLTGSYAAGHLTCPVSHLFF